MKQAFQSSTNGAKVAAKATDGVLNTHVEYCTHTEPENGAWWIVDLENQYRVTTVTLVNRSDCCAERLKDFDIEVSKTWNSATNTGNFALCHHHVGQLGAGETKTISCDSDVIGRFLRITLTGSNLALTLCEVEVRGEIVCS